MNRHSFWLWMILGAFSGTALALAIMDSSGAGPINRFRDLFGYGGRHTDDADHGRDLFHTGVDISGLKQGEPYASFDRRRDRMAIRTYFGFGCLADCAAIAEGYRWAVQHQIRKISDCRGPSWPALEGCAAYMLGDPRVSANTGCEGAEQLVAAISRPGRAARRVDEPANVDQVPAPYQPIDHLRMSGATTIDSCAELRLGQQHFFDLAARIAAICLVKKFTKVLAHRADAAEIGRLANRPVR